MQDKHSHVFCTVSTVILSYPGVLPDLRSIIDILNLFSSVGLRYTVFWQPRTMIELLGNEVILFLFAMSIKY